MVHGKGTEMMVSVIIITYGHEKYIQEAINGVFIQQTDFPVELIIANDCSPDRTDEVVKLLLSRAPENITVRYTKHKTNKGMNSNFLWAASQATGKYIALCEGDDYWTDPLKLQKQVDFLEASPDFSICFHAVEEVSEKSSHYQVLKAFPAENEYTLEDLAKKNFIHTPSVVFRNNMKTLPVWFQFSPIGDYPLHMLNAQFGKIKYFPHKMAAYRVGSGIWSNLQVSERIINTLFTLKLLKDYFAEINKPVSALLQEQHLYLIKKLHNSDDTDKLITSFLSDTKEIEIRLTAKKLLDVVVYKIMRKLKLS